MSITSLYNLMPNLAHKRKLGYGPGRPLGQANVLSNTVRLGLLAVWERTGGVEGMVKWVEESSENRGQFYGYLTKILPHELAESGAGTPIRVLVYAPQAQANLAHTDASSLSITAQEQPEATEAPLNQQVS